MSDKILVGRKRERHPYEPPGFMLISKAGLAELLERLNDHSVGMQAMRVLIAMATSVDYENRVEASQKSIAAMLGMSQAEVSKACRALTECGFIKNMESRRGWYRISPHLLWRGSAHTLKQALSEWRYAA